jgi:cobalamin biosynthesis protein CobD/CbiB
MLVPIQVHYLIALIVFAALLVGLFTQGGRRVALWALAAQLLAGLWLIFSGLRPSPWHPVLWLGAALLTQAAIFTGKRSDRGALTVGLIVLALACAAGAYYLGLTYQR